MGDNFEKTAFAIVIVAIMSLSEPPLLDILLPK
jgi:hypothetical protein